MGLLGPLSLCYCIVQIRASSVDKSLLKYHLRFPIYVSTIYKWYLQLLNGFGIINSPFFPLMYCVLHSHLVSLIRRMGHHQIGIIHKCKLTTAQMEGPAPLPCPIPAMGEDHLVLDAKMQELPKSVWIWCSMWYKVWIILSTSGRLAPSWQKQSAAINTDPIIATFDILIIDCCWLPLEPEKVVQKPFIQTLSNH